MYSQHNDQNIKKCAYNNNISTTTRMSRNARTIIIFFVYFYVYVINNYHIVYTASVCSVSVQRSISSSYNSNKGTQTLYPPPSVKPLQLTIIRNSRIKGRVECFLYFVLPPSGLARNIKSYCVLHNTMFCIIQNKPRPTFSYSMYYVKVLLDSITKFNEIFNIFNDLDSIKSTFLTVQSEISKGIISLDFSIG